MGRWGQSDILFPVERLKQFRPLVYNTLRALKSPIRHVRPAYVAGTHIECLQRHEVESGHDRSQKYCNSTTRAGRIIAEYLEPGPRDANETITRLIAVLDRQDLARAMERLDSGYGLRVVRWCDLVSTAYLNYMGIVGRLGPGSSPTTARNPD